MKNKLLPNDFTITKINIIIIFLFIWANCEGKSKFFPGLKFRKLMKDHHHQDTQNTIQIHYYRKKMICKTLNIFFINWIVEGLVYRNNLSVSTFPTKWIPVIKTYHKTGIKSFCDLIKRTYYFKWNPIIRKCSLN